MSAPSSQKWKFLSIFKCEQILFCLGFSTYKKNEGIDYLESSKKQRKLLFFKVSSSKVILTLS